MRGRLSYADVEALTFLGWCFAAGALIGGAYVTVTLARERRTR